MSREALRTLFHPLASGVIASPGADARLLFLGAEPGFVLPEGLCAHLTLVQGFRPYYLDLQAAGHVVVPRAEGSGYDVALVLCGRHRGQNEAWIADAVERIRPGGLVVVGGSRDEGIGSLRKRLAGLVEIGGNLPKHHGAAFWFDRPADHAGVIAALRAGGRAALVEGRFATAPGMFSHDRVDPGSRLLAEHLPQHCRGAAADFGAGWGFLAAALAERVDGLASVDLYEADYEALEAARLNVGGLEGPAFGFFWHDLVREEVAGKYDLIVMNPPFHRGRAAEPAIGQAMIAAASSALRPGGGLLMVHNRGLPYGDALSARFADVAEVAGDAGYRVVLAKEPTRLNGRPARRRAR